MIQAWAGPIETDGVEQQQLDQRYNFSLWQDVSPWLKVFGSYRFTSFRSSIEDGVDFDRSTSQPGLGLFYERPTFSARIQAFDRAIRSSVATQNLDVRSYTGDLDWQPSWGPRFLLRVQDDTNTSDPAVFGRDTEARRLTFNILEDRHRTWSARYAFEVSDTQNNITAFQLQDVANILRLTYSNGWWNDRWSLSADSRVRYLDRKLESGAGIPLRQPVPTREGLFAVNTAPSAGELEPVPSLVDGDLEIPASPPIDIGGANSFRNIGADLGVTRPITQLEITVDRPSGPGVFWEVWQSPDNLNWFRVAGTQSLWDGTFLRYIVSFPETTDRFFKAVNLSANPAVGVLVTEIRALVESELTEESTASGTDGWLDLRTALTPHRRAQLTLFGLGRKDIALATGEANRSRDTLDYGGQLRLELARKLELRLNYRITNLREDEEPVLETEEARTSATLEWRPLATVNVRAIAAHRDETQGDQPVRDSDTLILRAATDLFPRLTITNQWLHSEIEDAFFGFLQTTQRWSIDFDGKPTGNWTLGGALTFARYDSTGVTTLTSRNTIQLRTTWLVTPYLSLSGGWNYGRDNLQNTLSQRYSASWSPGRKLALTVAYSQTDSGTISLTRNTNGTLNYRLNRWFKMWLSINNSRTELSQLPDSETTSYRFGVNLNI